MYPKISFITVVRNDPKGLKSTLDNINALNYPHKEIVVIDGASTDSTLDIANEMIEIIDYYVSEPDGGIYDAMNKGIKAATGKFLWFVNAGDKVMGIERLYELFTTDNFLMDIYYGETLIVDQEGEPQGLRRKKLPKKLTVSSFKKGMVVCHQSFLMRRSVTPLYDISYRFSADYKWMMECVKRAKSNKNTGCVLSEFKLGGATTKNHKASLKERFKIMKEYFGLFTTLCNHFGFVLDAIFKKKYR